MANTSARDLFGKKYSELTNEEKIAVANHGMAKATGDTATVRNIENAVQVSQGASQQADSPDSDTLLQAYTQLGNALAASGQQAGGLGGDPAQTFPLLGDAVSSVDLSGLESGQQAIQDELASFNAPTLSEIISALNDVPSPDFSSVTTGQQDVIDQIKGFVGDIDQSQNFGFEDVKAGQNTQTGILLDALKDSIANVPQTDLSGVTAGQQAIQDQLESFNVPTLEDINQALSGIPRTDLSGLVSGQQSLLGTLGDLESTIASGQGDLQSVLNTGNQAVIDAISNIPGVDMSGVIGALGDVSGGQQSVLGTLGDLESTIATGQGNLQSALNTGNQAVIDAIQNIPGVDLSGVVGGQEDIIGGIGSLGDTFDQGLEGLADILREAEASDKESDKAFLDTMRGALGEFGGDVKGAVSGIGSALSEAFGGLGEAFEKQAEFQRRGGVLGEIFRKFEHQRKFGMNEEAQAEYDKLAANLPSGIWNSMSEEERVQMARKPQMDRQLPHAFIDGHPTTPIQKQIAQLTGGKAPTSTIYGPGGEVDIYATAATALQGDGAAGAGGTTQPNVPWWEVPRGTQPGTPVVTPPVITPPGPSAPSGLPGYLARELSPTVDFTGTFRPGLLGGVQLPSQQITGLLAPQPTRNPVVQQALPNLLNRLAGGIR